MVTYAYQVTFHTPSILVASAKFLRKVVSLHQLSFYS